MNRKSVFGKLDWSIIAIYIFMVFIGWLNIYASVFSEANSGVLDFTQRQGKQFIWILAAILIALVILLIDAKFYSYFSPFIFIFSMLLLGFVLVFGKEVNGAKSWIAFGSFQLQPSEFAKFAAALMIARLMSRFGFEVNKPKNILLFSLMVLAPAFLIMMQNDMGSATVFFSFFIVLIREGIKLEYLFFIILLLVVGFLAIIIDLLLFVLILIILTALLYYLYSRNLRNALRGLLIIAGAMILMGSVNYLFRIGLSEETVILLPIALCSVIFFLTAYFKRIPKLHLFILGLLVSLLIFFTVNYVFEQVLDDYQRTRINIMLGLESDPYGAGWNVHQSKIAIGSGGFTGKGFLKGTQTKYDFVPEQSTDFIFCTLGEEWGFLGAGFFILLYLVFLYRILIIAERQRSNFSRIYAYSVWSVFFYHFLVNIGMTLGIVPVIGIPLPFLSYGGSSLWGFTILLFILIRLDADRDQVIS